MIGRTNLRQLQGQGIGGHDTLPVMLQPLPGGTMRRVAGQIRPRNCGACCGMETWHVLLTLGVAVVVAFPVAIVFCAGLGWIALRWKNTRLCLWMKKRGLREGKVIVRWPAMDLREDVCIVDLSRIAQDEVGVKRRRYCVLHRTTPPPEYGDLEYVTLREV